MKIVFCSILFLGLSFISFSQVKELSNHDKQKEKVSNNSNEKPLSQSNFRQSSRINVKNKIKQLPRKENYEITPKGE
jgi:hypothetical protein